MQPRPSNEQKSTNPATPETGVAPTNDVRSRCGRSASTRDARFVEASPDGESAGEPAKRDVTALVRIRALAVHPAMVGRAERRVRGAGWDVANETIRILWGSKFFAPLNVDAEDFAMRVVWRTLASTCVDELRRRYRRAALLVRIEEMSS